MEYELEVTDKAIEKVFGIMNNDDDYSPKTKKGDILIFPSDIQHFVMPNQREEDRISISMNLQLC